MEFARLGNTSIQISRIGFGCGPASGYDYGPVDKSAWREAVRVALDRGINFFDVADVYGFGAAEEMLAEALGDERRRVVIATKCGLSWGLDKKVRRDLSPTHIVTALENSLRRLSLDFIPLYQIHWPDPSIPIESVMETLRRCQDAGKIRCIGVSNFSCELLKQARSLHPFDSHQTAYNLLCRDADVRVFPWCEMQGVTNVAHSGLARGLLAGRRPLGSEFSDTRRGSPYFSSVGQQEKQRLLDSLRAVSRQTGKSMAGVSIRWLLDDHRIGSVLIGVKDRLQLEEVLEAIGWQLTADTHAHLSSLSDRCPVGLAGVPAHAAAWS